jgi:hypothetical protein
MRVRAIRLPERFYLPRTGADGVEIRDVMPWEGAVSYATDGNRLGIQFDDGRVLWLGKASAAEAATPAASEARAPDGSEPRLAELAEDFEGVNLDAVVEGLRNYTDIHPVLKTVWSEDLQALDALRAKGPGADEAEAS